MSVAGLVRVRASESSEWCEAIGATGLRAASGLRLALLHVADAGASG